MFPLAGAQAIEVSPAEVDTTLYFHPINFQDMPLNTQEPTYDPALMSSEFGPTSMTLTCLHPITGDIAGTGQGTGGLTSQEMHTFRSYSSASYVEYDSPSPDGTPRTHPERTLGYDVPFNASVQPVLHWFMRESSGEPDAPQRSALANVVVRVAIREGLPVSVDDKSYDQGAIIMEGVTRPVTAIAGQVTGEGADQVTASEVDGTWVYGFAVPLALQADHFSRATGFTVRIDILVDVEQCEEGSIMPGGVEVLADAQHQPRIELRNGKPLEVGYAAALDAGNRSIHLAWAVNSGWGNYDVAVADSKLQVYGPVDVEPMPAYTIQRYHEHYHMMDPVEQAWTVEAGELPDGRYTAIFTVPNLQHTAIAKATVTFNVQDGRLIEGAPQEAPALAPMALLFLLGALVAVRRR